MRDITSKWAKIVTENKDRQKEIQDKVDSLQATADTVLGIDGADGAVASLRSFIEDVDELLGYIIAQRGIDPPVDNSFQPLDSQGMVINEKGKKRRRSKSCRISDFTPAEIEARAKLMNLMDFPAFVRILNTINQAGRGALGQPGK